MHEHIDELAELYAVGALNESERAGVDMHARYCSQCAARLGEAERFIADTIEDRQQSPALDRRVRAAFAPQRLASRWRSLVAAAFVLGLLPGAIFGLLHHPSPSDSDLAIPAMVNSHFLHAQFTPIAPGAPKAKVVYGRGSPWRFFIAQTSHAYVVRTQSGTVLGTLHVSGNAAELFVPNNRDRAFVLFDGARPVAKAVLR